MDLAAATTAVLLSHNHSQGDAPLLEEIWPSLKKAEVKITSTERILGLFFDLIPPNLESCNDRMDWFGRDT